jgi:hypothetical protein
LLSEVEHQQIINRQEGTQDKRTNEKAKAVVPLRGAREKEKKNFNNR